MNDVGARRSQLEDLDGATLLGRELRRQHRGGHPVAPVFILANVTPDLGHGAKPDGMWPVRKMAPC